MASTHGYLVGLVRVNVAQRPRELQRLSECGADGKDLFQLICTAFEEMGPQFRLDESAEGFRLKSSERSGRTLWVKINKGPAGIEGEAYHMDTEESVETTERQALLSGLRAMYFIPKDSYYGVLMIERIGRRNLKALLERWITQPATQQLRESIVRVQGFAESADWQNLLADKQVLQISEVMKSGSSSDDASTAEEKLVKVTVSGTAVRRATTAVHDMIVNRARKQEERLDLVTEHARMERKSQTHVAGADGFTVDDADRLTQLADALSRLDTSNGDGGQLGALLADLTPTTPEENLQHFSYDVALGEQRPERVFSVERDSIPQFVYELPDRRLGDTELRAVWLDHAVSLLHNRGVQLPDGWASSDSSDA